MKINRNRSNTLIYKEIIQESRIVVEVSKIKGNRLATINIFSFQKTEEGIYSGKFSERTAKHALKFLDGKGIKPSVNLTNKYKRNYRKIKIFEIKFGGDAGDTDLDD